MRKALLLLPLLALAAGCGAAKSTPPPVYTSPAAPQVQLPKGDRYLGKDSKVVGTIVVPKASVLHWASDSPVFQLWDSGQRIKVRTQEHAGSVRLAPGTYRKVQVIAFGRWVITISPK